MMKKMKKRGKLNRGREENEENLGFSTIFL
jgi:hypothetical protein